VSLWDDAARLAQQVGWEVTAVQKHGEEIAVTFRRAVDATTTVRLDGREIVRTVTREVMNQHTRN